MMKHLAKMIVKKDTNSGYCHTAPDTAAGKPAKEPSIQENGVSPWLRSTSPPAGLSKRRSRTKLKG